MILFFLVNKISSDYILSSINENASKRTLQYEMSTFRLSPCSQQSNQYNLDMTELEKFSDSF